MRTRVFAASLLLSMCLPLRAGWCADQTRIGDGNATAIATASKSQVVASAFAMLKSRAAKVHDAAAREATLDAITKAQGYTGIKGKSRLVREALNALMEREAARRLARLGGVSPNLKAPPRRRPKLA